MLFLLSITVLTAYAIILPAFIIHTIWLFVKPPEGEYFFARTHTVQVVPRFERGEGKRSDVYTFRSKKKGFQLDMDAYKFISKKLPYKELENTYLVVDGISEHQRLI